MKKLKMPKMPKIKMTTTKWLVMAGVVGSVVIGTSVLALVRVLRSRDDQSDDQKPEGTGQVRHRRHGRHGDRRAKAGVSETSNAPLSGSESASGSASAGEAGQATGNGQRH